MLAVLLPLLAIIISLSLLVYLMTAEQRHVDKTRTTYRLSFPSGMDADQVTAWMRSISGVLQNRRFGGSPTVAFEIWATPAGIEHRIKVPFAQCDYVVAQLRSLVPGIRVEPEDDVPYKRWSHAVEIGLTKNSRQLRIYNVSTTATSILSAVQSVKSGETLMMQWVVTPAPPAPLPVYRSTQSDSFDMRSVWYGNEANRDEVKDRRDKLSEPNLMAVLRVAAVAKEEKRARMLVEDVKRALASTRSPHTHFEKRFATKKSLQARIDEVRTPVVFGMMVNSSELAALVAWPIDNPFITGLPPALARQLPAPETVPRKGRVIGLSNFPGNERPIAIGFDDVRKHVHVIGPSGAGKTTLLANMMKQDMEAGHGVVLIENKGDLFRAAMRYVPKTRLDDVIVVDVTDKGRPVGFNVLQQGDPMVVVDEANKLVDTNLRLVSFTIYAPNQAPRDALVESKTLDKLFGANVDFDAVVKTGRKIESKQAPEAKTRKPRGTGTKPEKIDYLATENFGLIHRGKVTDEEAKLVRENMAQANKNREREGQPKIGDDPKDASRYGLS